MTRIEPLEPPYDDAVAAQLAAMMPPGVPPIRLFRTFARNLAMTQAMTAWGRYELGRDLSLSMREREIVIDRTCARCEAEYEWGVHVAFFAERVGLDAAQLASLTRGGPDDACWTDHRERLLIEVVDSLHTSSNIAEELWVRLAAEFSEAEILDIVLLCGWYHAISFAVNVTAVTHEDRTPRFTDVA
jgi:alkylhydroperoxidase family enzyme